MGETGSLRSAATRFLFRRSAVAAALSLAAVGALAVAGEHTPPNSTGSVALGPGSTQLVVDDGKDIGWWLDGGRSGYSTMINQVRARVKASQLYSSVELSTSNSHDYFTINVRRSGRSSNDAADIRIVVRARDLYLQGYYDTANAVYYRFNDATLTDYRPTTRARVVVLPYDSQYSSVTQKANQNLNSPVFRLYDIDYNTGILADLDATTAQRAGALLSYVELIAEAARFDYISNNIQANLDWTDGWRVDNNAIQLMKDWKKLTTALIESLNTGHVVVRQEGDLRFNTLQMYAAQMAIALNPKLS